MKKHKHFSSLEEHIKSELRNHKAPYNSKSWKSLKTKLPKRSYTKWYWAAAIIGILSISAFLLNNKPSVSTQKNHTDLLSINNTKKIIPLVKKDKALKNNQPIKTSVKKAIAPTKSQEKTLNIKKTIPKKEENNILKNKNIDSSYIAKTLITKPIDEPITNWDLADISIQNQSLCSSSPIYFSIINLPKNCKVSWNFGDNTIATSYNTQHIYKKAGNYKIQLKIFNSEKQINIYKTVSIKKSPIASFYYKQEKNELILNNTSENATNTQWFVNGKAVSVNSLNKTFQYTGEYTLQLIVKNKNNCSDSYEETIHYKKDYKIYAPTAFVPNNDGVNDKYMVKYEILENYSYNFQIFNNLGVLIFESSKPTANWNGKIGNNIAPKGKYLWKLTIKNPKNIIEQFNGYFVLIREN